MNVFNEMEMTKKAVKRVQFISFQPLRVLMEKDDETLSEQVKELKKKVKTQKMNEIIDWLITEQVGLKIKEGF